MPSLSRILLSVCAVLLAVCRSAEPIWGQAQDPSLDHLVHPPGYVTGQPATLGEVRRDGRGPRHLVVIRGLGFSLSMYRDLVDRLGDLYTIWTVTLPGFGGTPAWAMPEATVGYPARPWIGDAANAIVDLMRREGITRPIVVGHEALGGLVAHEVTRRAPELVDQLVLVSAEPVRALTPVRDLAPAERRSAVDGPVTRGWFRTVTRATWDANMWSPATYSADSARGAAIWREVAAVPMPVMIRYLAEFLGSDLRDDLRGSRVPTLVIRPGFDAGFRADSTNRNAVRLLHDSWDVLIGVNPRLEIVTINGARMFVMHDASDAFAAALRAFVERGDR